MHLIIIYAAHVPSMNSRYHHITLQSTSLLLTHRAYKDHMSVINITSYNGSKLGLSTDKFNKWLREALYIKHALPRGTGLLSGTILPKSTSSFMKVTPSGLSSHLKHRIGNRESKSYSARLTSELYYSCSSIKVKGGGVSSCRSASFDLASPELRVPDLR